MASLVVLEHRGLHFIQRSGTAIRARIRQVPGRHWNSGHEAVASVLM
jgi:hypothetical protein